MGWRTHEMKGWIDCRIAGPDSVFDETTEVVDSGLYHMDFKY